MIAGLPPLDTAVYSMRGYQEHAYYGPRYRRRGGWHDHAMRGRCGAAASHVVETPRGDPVPFSDERPKSCKRCARLMAAAHR